MASRLCTIFAVLLALAGVTLLAGCGDGGGDSVDDILKGTFGSDAKVSSGRLDVALKADLEGVENLSGPVSLSLKGPFQNGEDDKLPKFDFTVGLNASGAAYTAGATSLGDKGFLRFQDQSYAVSDTLFEQFRKGYADSQKEADKKDDTPSFASLGVDPRKWLTDPKKAEDTEIAGTAVYHVTAGIDVGRLLDDVDRVLARAGDLGVGGQNTPQVPQRITPAQRKVIADAVKSAKVDVFSGKDDKVLRRLALDVSFTVPEAQQAKGGGLSAGKVVFSLQIDDLNEDQDVKAPANSRPLEELLAQLQGITGAAGGSGSSGSGAATPPAAGSTTPSTTPQSTTPAAPATPQGDPDYLKCLQEAGEDLRKVQACAKFLSS